VRSLALLALLPSVALAGWEREATILTSTTSAVSSELTLGRKFITCTVATYVRWGSSSALFASTADLPLAAAERFEFTAGAKSLRVAAILGGSTGRCDIYKSDVGADEPTPKVSALSTVAATQSGAWTISSMSPAAGAVISIDGGIITVRGDVSAQMSAGTLINVDGGTITAFAAGVQQVHGFVTVDAGTITAFQGGAPWVSMVAPTSGALFNIDGGTVTAFQGGSPWTVAPSSGALFNIDGGTVTAKLMSSGAPAAAVPGFVNYIGGTDGTNSTPWHVDPCQREAKSVFVINTSTAVTTEIANQVSAEFFYICSINVVAAGAQGFAVVEDDTDACASPTLGLNGGVTGATGWMFGANGGISLGNGSSTVMKTTVANRYLCTMTSQAQQTSGTITYVSAP
jgi:hypothetical protein